MAELVSKWQQNAASDEIFVKITTFPFQGGDTKYMLTVLPSFFDITDETVPYG